jgi:hypothetical protein
MQDSTHSTVRFLRFSVWTLLMLTACLITLDFAPHRVSIVPCLFLPLFVPMVLLPMRRKPGSGLER